MEKRSHTREEKMQAFGRLLDIQDRLRKECPWDRKQTHESLRPNTIEEVYELCDALIKGNQKEICKELGDVMEHVVFYAMLGQETGDFDIADVCNAQADKLMFRHDFIDWNQGGNWTVTNPDMVINPQGQVVYKDEEQKENVTKPMTASEVSTTWEQRKQQERFFQGFLSRYHLSSRHTEYRTRHEMWALIGNKRKMCGTKYARNLANLR